MTPGPNHILKTPLTGSLVKISTIASGNTFGARFWTDGKREAPMLPDQPWLRCHPDTAELFWTDECEQVGQEEPWGEADEFTDAPFAQEPTIDDYLRALSDGMASSPEKERYIRMRLWWAANDSVRRGETTVPSWRGHNDNLNRLRALLNESDANQRLMAAEACRELGDFTHAAELLTFCFPKDFQHAVNRIKALNDQNDSTVREMA